MYLISAYFDEKTDRVLRRYIEKIARVSGNTFMTDNNVPPHLTISSIEAKSCDVLTGPFESLKGKLKKGRIRFVTVGQLLPYVFYAAPILDGYLEELSTLVYDGLKDIQNTSFSRFYRPGSWLPHVTLAKKLDLQQMRSAFEVMQGSFVPFEGEVTRIGLAAVNPHKDVSVYDLI